MKLRFLATVVVLALTTVAARAQLGVGLYLNPVATRVSNSVKDTGPFAFLGQNSSSQVFYGFDLGGYYEFFHAKSLDTSFDMRLTDVHANNALLKNFMVGVRVSGHPFTRPFKPYVQASAGLGSTKAPDNTVHIRKGAYEIYGGVDYTLAKHVDLRVIEMGYGTLTTVSSWTVGAGGNVVIPASNVLSFSSGLVFRF